MSQARKEALRKRLAAKANSQDHEDLQKSQTVLKEIMDKIGLANTLLAQDHFQESLDRYLYCKESLLSLSKSHHLKILNPKVIRVINIGIALCYANLRDWKNCKMIVQEDCEKNITSSIEAIAEQSAQKNDFVSSFELLNIVYKADKAFHSDQNIRLFGALLFKGFGIMKKTKRYALVFSLFEEAISKGVMSTYYNLGMFYQLCELPQFRNRAKAIENYLQSAKLGDARAHNELGVIYQDPNPDDPTILPDYASALLHFKQAANAKVSDAYLFLANIYNHTFKKPQKAIPWYQKAIDEKNCAFSLYYLAWLHLEGQGTTTDLNLALSLLCRSADLGNAMAMTAVGIMRTMGTNGIVIDPISGEKYLRMAADHNDPEGLYYLALLIYNKKMPSKDPQNEALSLSLRAAKLEHVEAMFLYAVLRQMTLVKYDEEVHKWYEKAADKDFTSAQIELIHYLVLYAEFLIEFNYFTHEQLVAKIVKTLKLISQSKNDISAKIARSQCQKLEESDRSVTTMTEIFLHKPSRALSTLEQELENISSSRQQSRQHRIAGILSRVRNTAWIDIDNVASALYHLGKVFEENSSNRAPFEDNKTKIIQIVKFVTNNADKLSSNSLVNIYLGLSKLHLHPDNVIMAACLHKVLPRLLENIEETIFLNHRKVFYAATHFLLTCEHSAAKELTARLLQLCLNSYSIDRLNFSQATECAYFLTLSSHFIHIAPNVLHEAFQRLSNKFCHMYLKMEFDHRTVHQWHTISTVFKHRFGIPLAEVENTLKPAWEKMSMNTTRSHLEDKVEACLIRLGICFEREKIFNGFPVDFYLPDYDLVLEINGPRHYLYGLNHIVPTPRDIARNKIVGKMIEPISYLQWDDWENQECCDDRLRALIEAHQQITLKIKNEVK